MPKADRASLPSELKIAGSERPAPERPDNHTAVFGLSLNTDYILHTSLLHKQHTLSISATRFVVPTQGRGPQRKNTYDGPRGGGGGGGGEGM